MKKREQETTISTPDTPPLSGDTDTQTTPFPPVTVADGDLRDAPDTRAAEPVIDPVTGEVLAPPPVAATPETAVTDDAPAAAEFLPHADSSFAEQGPLTGDEVPVTLLGGGPVDGRYRSQVPFDLEVWVEQPVKVRDFYEPQRHVYVLANRAAGVYRYHRSTGVPPRAEVAPEPPTRGLA